MAFALGRCTHLLSRNVVAEGAATHASISLPVKYHHWTSSSRGHATRLVLYRKAGAAQSVTKVQAEYGLPIVEVAFYVNIFSQDPKAIQTLAGTTAPYLQLGEIAGRQEVYCSAHQ